MPRATERDFRVVAIVSAFNEADLISPVIGHLVENGVDVYLIDNHSTDGTVEEARRWLRKGLIGIEEFPADRPAGEGPPPFDWEAILRRKEELAKELPAHWFIHHDADEFREAPWPRMSLRDAIRWVDRLGYNCIDFRVLNFPPLDNGFEPGTAPDRHFTHWEDPVVYDTLQRKAWKAQKTPVSLAASGGHEARFPDRRIFPIRFLLRHYPIRSQEHGVRKVFDERKKRFVEKERAKGWHVQYDSIVESHSFLGDPGKLHPYDPDRVRLDLMLENETSRGNERKAAELAELAEARQKDLETAALLKHEAEKHAANLERDRETLARHIAHLEDVRGEKDRHIAKLDGMQVEEARHIANLEATLAHLQTHSSGLEKDRETLGQRIAELEVIRADREARAAGLEAKVTELERHAAGLERDRETLTKHVSHLERHSANLETVRAELERHAAGLEEERRHLRSELDSASRRAAELEGRRLELSSRIAELEARSKDLEDRFAAMRIRANAEESLRRDVESRADRLEQDLDAMQQSTSWRMTAPVRWVLDQVKKLFR